MRVLDANDNVPEFEKSRYAVEMRPNVSLGFSVLEVKASDKDEGENARISYRLESVSGRPPEGDPHRPASPPPTTSASTRRAAASRRPSPRSRPAPSTS